MCGREIFNILEDTHSIHLYTMRDYERYFLKNPITWNERTWHPMRLRPGHRADFKMFAGNHGVCMLFMNLGKPLHIHAYSPYQGEPNFRKLWSRNLDSLRHGETTIRQRASLEKTVIPGEVYVERDQMSMSYSNVLALSHWTLSLVLAYFSACVRKAFYSILRIHVCCVCYLQFEPKKIKWINMSDGCPPFQVLSNLQRFPSPERDG